MRAEPGDRDEFFHVTSDGQSDIDVAVHLRDQRPARGKVSEVFDDGVGVVLPKSVSLALGTVHQLTLSVDACERLVTLTAIVRARSDRGADRRYGFRFASKREVEAQLPLGLRSLCNRRRAERFQLRQPLAVTLSPLAIFPAHGSLPPPSLSSAAVLAKLDGVSNTGCSLVLNRASDERLTASERVLIRVDLAAPPRLIPVKDSIDSEGDAPDTTRTLCIEATVHHRVLCEDGNVRYGCELAPLDREGGAAILRFISYLQDRDREPSS